MLVTPQVQFPRSAPIALGGTTDAVLLATLRGVISARVTAGSVVLQLLRWLDGVGGWEIVRATGQPVAIRPSILSADGVSASEFLAGGGYYTALLTTAPPDGDLANLAAVDIADFGAGVSTTIDAVDVEYQPSVPSNWDGPPTQGQEAWDELAARVRTLPISGPANQVLATPNGSTGATALRALVYPDLSALVGSGPSTIAAGNDSRFNPAPSAAGRIVYDTGSGWSALAAGAANTLLQSNGAAAPSWTAAPTVSGANLTANTIAYGSLATAVQDRLMAPANTGGNMIMASNGTTWIATAATGIANRILTSGASAPSWAAALNGITIDASLNTISNLTTSMLASGFNLAATNGGTGQTSYAVGDLLYASTTTALSKLAAGTSGYVLTAAGASTAPAWAAPITNTTGASSLSGTYNVTGSYAKVGLSVSLPSAGKYHVWGEVRCQLQVSVSTGNITIRLYDSTAAAAISNSERISVFSQSSVLAGSTVPISEIITVAGASTIDVQAITAAGPTYTSAQILSDSSGRSRLFYEKIGP